MKRMEASIEHLVSRLRETGGDGLVAVLAYGSRLVSASPDRHSAWDLIVVVDDYGAFYRALSEGGYTARSAGLLATVSRVLAPTVIAFWPAPPDGPLAKCLVLSRADFQRELGPRRLDHFCLGRMAHHISVVHARDPEAAAWVEELIAGARRMVLDWTLPFLEGSFSVDDFCRRMLEISYAGEIRPERGGRVSAVYEAQRETLRGIYTPILEAEVASGVLERTNGKYRAARPASSVAQLRLNAYFGISKARATTRWVKHMLTFDSWFPYIVRKVERRTGMTFEITPLERRFPFPLLLPKALRVLRAARAQSTAHGRSAGGRGRPASGARTSGSGSSGASNGAGAS